VAAASTLSAACGTMASSQLHAAAERAALAQGGIAAQSQSAAPGVTGPATAATAPSGIAVPATTAPAPGANTAPPASQTGAVAPTNAAHPSSSGKATPVPGAPSASAATSVAGSSGNGGATDVGVTPTSITAGTVATLSGPIPGLYRGAVAGVQAYFAYANSQGGVNGRQLKVDVHDDGFQCAQNQAQTAAAAKSDFAVVGGFSLYDNCGAQALQQTPTVPDLQEALSQQRSQLPNNFSVQPVVPGFRTGGLQYYKSTFGDAYQHTGLLYFDTPAVSGVLAGMKGAMASLGYNIVYTRAVGATDSNFTSDVIRMRSNGVKFVELLTSGAMISEFMQAAAQQNYAPVVTTPGQSYDVAVLKQGGSAVNGLYADMPNALYFSPTEAQTLPAVGLLQTWMQRAAPGVGIDLFSAYGWSEAQLFVQAVRAAGPKVTRAAVVKALQAVKSFDADGLMAVGYPATKAPTVCYVIVKVVNGQYQRVDTPAGQYRCDGAWFRAS
jgi:ABC-type branched-subunit amino acid transport system substrate-binding protein